MTTKHLLGKRKRDQSEKFTVKKRRRSDDNLLKDIYPDIFKELHQDLNIGVDFNKLQIGSHKLLTWKCVNHTTCIEHTWPMEVAARARLKTQTVCPFCPYNFKGTVRTELKHCDCNRPSFLNKNGTQKDPTNPKKLCNINSCRNEFETHVSRIDERGSCQKCKNDRRNERKNNPKMPNFLKNKYPEIYKELQVELNPDIDLENITCSSTKCYKWKCVQHSSCEEHTWTDKPVNRIRYKIGCKICKSHENEGGKKLYCKCNRPKWLNVDGSQNGDVIMKKCGRKDCLKELPIDQFNDAKTCYDGHKSRCKSCESKSGEEIRTIKAAILKLFLSGKKCVDCGESETNLLECDHINDDKFRKKNGKKIRGITEVPLNKIVDEIRKCEVVCRMCHQKRTTKRRFIIGVQQDPPCVKRRRELVTNFKLNCKKCEICSLEITMENKSCFDLDHIDPTTKLYNISQILHMNSKYIKIELKKCRLLCKHCHLRHTIDQFNHRSLSDFPSKILELAKTYLKELYTPIKPTVNNICTDNKT